jgi:hypothetical protein
LQQQKDSAAWKKIEYKPIIEGDLQSASTSYKAPAGIASASWSVEGGAVTYKITVPVGSVGRVTLPVTNLAEGGNAVTKAEGDILSVATTNGTTVVEVGSGSYTFTGALAQ